MGITFRDKEKLRYHHVKGGLFSNKAQHEGTYNGKPRSFCLADDCSSENLYGNIRDSAIEYFETRKIPWHDGLEKRRIPSNHLCCSQSCCVNFFYPMVSQPALLKSVFENYYPLSNPLPINMDDPLQDGSSPFLAFEWIGIDNYLGETMRKGANRTRGANFTSADFTFRFKRNDDKIQIVLGEWKYTEYYAQSDKGTNEVRKNNYRKAFYRNGGIFMGNNEDIYGSLFFEPYCQLMRLQLLAQEMQEAREMGADLVTVLHICPEANNEFRQKVTSPKLREMYPGKDTLEVWKELVPENKFKSISVENFLDTIVEYTGSENREWAEYLKVRYGWDKRRNLDASDTPSSKNAY